MDNSDMKYLTVDEIKTITRMSNDSIRRHIRNGNIKATKCGVRYLVKPSDLQAFMDMNASEHKLQNK
jgi:excisionase family DNA binding protein